MEQAGFPLLRCPFRQSNGKFSFFDYVAKNLGFFQEQMIENHNFMTHDLFRKHQWIIWNNGTTIGAWSRLIKVIVHWISKTRAARLIKHDYSSKVFSVSSREKTCFSYWCRLRETMVFSSREFSPAKMSKTVFHTESEKTGSLKKQFNMPVNVRFLSCFKCQPPKTNELFPVS